MDIIPNSIILHGGNLYRGIIFALMNTENNINIENLKENIKNTIGKPIVFFILFNFFIATPIRTQFIVWVKVLIELY